MNLIIKQISVGLAGAIFFTLILLSITFFMFPLEGWRQLFTTEYNDIRYLPLIVGTAVFGGVITGVSYGVHLRGKLYVIQGQLEDLRKGQKINDNPLSNGKELEEIQKLLLQVEEKFDKQAEVSQRLATERAEEREKSLQEVVLQERNRLARELHDSVSQQLFAASMMMSAINEANPPEDPVAKKQLEMVEKMIDQSQLEMRALLLHLRPIALNKKSLSEGMDELLEELQQKVPMEVHWKIEPMSLEKGVEDQLFRILQESVSNALRHSKAEHLHVMLIERDNYVIMRVTDDGIGFRVEDEKTNSSYGLKNMQERAMEIGGSLKIVSVEGEGSRLEVKVPYRRREVE
ncbi:sensor histidine kinase [Evansella sp. AB-rgal1]|uniref:sensor histidine kinase n=1 Tax=Evansella sp. AB-rgal1 TaxID=3242696 RepID=UPI00359D0F05